MAVLFCKATDIAERFAVSKSVVYAWVARRQIPFRWLNGCLRFPIAEIELWEQPSPEPTPKPFPRVKARPRINQLDSIIASAKRAAYNPRPRGSQHKPEPKKGG